MKPTREIYADYYEKTFSPDEIEAALELYLAYMEHEHLAPK